MMNESLLEWFRVNGFENSLFSPERLGAAHIIYAMEWHLPLAALFLEPDRVAPFWSCEKNLDFTGSLFRKLWPIVCRDHASWIFVETSKLDGDVADWEQPVNESIFSPLRLRLFESGVGKFFRPIAICLVFNDRAGVIVFDRRKGFAITYYGSDDRWALIREALAM
jgi:hypothetical protein